MCTATRPPPLGFLKEHLCPQSQVCLIFIWRGQQCFEGFTHCHSIANKWKQIACFLNFVVVALAITKESFSVVSWPLPLEGKGDNCRKPDLIFSHRACLFLLFLFLFSSSIRLQLNFTAQHSKSPLLFRTWYKMKSHKKLTHKRESARPSSWQASVREFHHLACGAD